MDRFEVRQLLTDALEGTGFVKRGAVHFRVIGDGILQCIKFAYELHFEAFQLYVGLFSMYGELEERWFTSSGCIPRYPAVNYIGKRFIVTATQELSGNTVHYLSFETASPEEQVDVLKNYSLPELDAMQSQKELVDMICRLDVVCDKEIYWNDFEKFSPFLKAGEYENAERVIRAILKQHESCHIFKKPLNFDELLTEESLDWMPEEDQILVKKLALAHRGDPEEINRYLLDNLQRNNQFARFCIRPRAPRKRSTQ